MAKKTIVLTADERAICRVRYNQVATYMDPGSQPMTPNDRICKAIAGHWKNGEELECGSEYSPLLFPFGNKRAVSRHVNKGGPETESADRAIALAWVEKQPESHKSEILMLLGLADKNAEFEDDVDVKEVPVKEEDDAADSKVGVKRKREELDESEVERKPDVNSKSKRHRDSVDSKEASQEVKQEAADVAVKTEVKTENV
ncbi:hypothetical protein B0H10DRAFT_2067878 [Mycena sp. CBHHK59/15]|nr:hypothetical protein B0H10DRAFT_2067878 [Mycena sp. CBHHK59/15]